MARTRTSFRIDDDVLEALRHGAGTTTDVLHAIVRTHAAMTTSNDGGRVVALLRLPFPLDGMTSLNACIEACYGEGCTVTEEPEGWLKVIAPDK